MNLNKKSKYYISTFKFAVIIPSLIIVAAFLLFFPLFYLDSGIDLRFTIITYTILVILTDYIFGGKENRTRLERFPYRKFVMFSAISVLSLYFLIENFSLSYFILVLFSTCFYSVFAVITWHITKLERLKAGFEAGIYFEPESGEVLVETADVSRERELLDPKNPIHLIKLFLYLAHPISLFGVGTSLIFIEKYQRRTLDFVSLFTYSAALTFGLSFGIGILFIFGHYFMPRYRGYASNRWATASINKRGILGPGSRKRSLMNSSFH